MDRKLFATGSRFKASNIWIFCFDFVLFCKRSKKYYIYKKNATNVPPHGMEIWVTISVHLHYFDYIPNLPIVFFLNLRLTSSGGATLAAPRSWGATAKLRRPNRILIC